MADTICVLGQGQPNANTLYDLVLTPLGSTAVISTLFVANQSSSCANFTIYISRGNATASNSQIIYPNVEVFGNSTFPITAGITLGETDILRVKSSNGQCSFTACGTRIAP